MTNITVNLVLIVFSIGGFIMAWRATKLTEKAAGKMIDLLAAVLSGAGCFIMAAGCGSAYERFKEAEALHPIDYGRYANHWHLFVDKFTNDLSIIGFGLAVFAIGMSIVLAKG